MVLQHVKTHYLEAGAKIPGEPEVLDLTSEITLSGPDNSGLNNNNNGLNSYWASGDTSQFVSENNEASVMHMGQQQHLTLVNGGVNVSANPSLAPPQVPPAPFRCGHCHQVSNWKHVIQVLTKHMHDGARILTC